MLRYVLAGLCPGLVLGVLSVACAPSSTAPAPEASPSADAFAVVRATSQAAYQAGQSAMASGDYLQACIDFDAAKTNDPDNRPEIQQALEQALSRCLTPPPQPTSPPAVAQQRTIVVATLAAGVTSALSGTLTPIPGAAAAATAVAPPPGTPTSVAAASTPGGVASPTAAANAPTAAGNPSLVPWTDPQGRFSIGAPSDWKPTNQPQTLVGAGVIQFQDPTGAAEVDVAVDSSSKAVSPELYAASLELAMQQQVPGYASEQITPGVTSGNPSIQRTFTFTEKDASGQDHQARGVQLTVVKGSTPYIISASAPAERFQQYSQTFDQIVGSFKFS